jgi:glucosamine-6-phosphate deaminase
MSLKSPLRRFQVGRAAVEVYPSKSDAGQAASQRASAILRSSITEKGNARLIMATGNSQEDFVAWLVQVRDVDWSRLEVFHMDEYINLPETHRGCLKRWLNEHFVELVRPGRVHYLDGNAADLPAECRRYEQLLRAAPTALCTLGIGENGHIAFNDPHVADFEDPLGIKRVVLDERCRRQQANEGHFPDFASVPREAVTLTCPTLMSCDNLICCVPELRKAEAVKNALEGPLSTQCPASVLRTHPSAFIYLDSESASLLENASG